MPSSSFDAQTQNLLFEVRAMVNSINGRLLNPNCPDKAELEAVRKSLRDEIKLLKKKFYLKSSAKILANSKLLVAKVSSYNTDNMNKQKRY